MSRQGGLRRVESEIVQEKAAALGRAGERLEAALATLDALARAFEAAADDLRRDELREAYRVTRAHARTARLHLVIQREALGLRSHRLVDLQFPEPEAPPWLRTGPGSAVPEAAG
jgi:hypothetical protein